MPDQPNPPSPDRDPPKDFGPHADYSTLMLGARRKAAPHIGAPAINRHLGFWVADKLALKREMWIKHIEVAFVRLYRHLVGLSRVSEVSRVSRVSTPSKQKKDDSKPRLYLIHRSYAIEDGGLDAQLIKESEGAPTRHQRFLLWFVWQSMPVSLVLELFDEYFTLSTTIDLSGCLEASNTDLQKGIEAFNCLTSKRYCRVSSDDAAAGAPEASEFTGAFDVIFNTVWQTLYADIFAIPFTAHAKTLGKVFAEFRSFVACRDGPSFITTNGKAGQPPDMGIGDKRFKRKDAARCVDAIRPFMEADARLACENDDKDGADVPEPREFTFTPVLDGRYIYASALGTPAFSLRDGHPRLTYMLLAANHCPSELGLLVDGFHVLGTTRLAALYDFAHVTRAALELRDLEGEINSMLRKMMEGTTGDAAAGDKLAENLSKHSRRLAEIEQGIAKNNPREPQIVGGLPFRVERSHYYQRQFRTLVRGLRIGRIQGFLTYDEAVARRLGGIYDLIDTVGIRHERVCETLAGLSRRVQAARAHELQETIKKGTQDILYLHGRITKLTEDIDRDQKGVEKLQQQGVKTQIEVMRIQLLGEALLTIFLVPYYVLNLLLHGLSCQLDEWCAHKSVAWRGININLEQTITLFVFLLCAFIGGIRVWRNLREIRRTPTTPEAKSEGDAKAADTGDKTEGDTKDTADVGTGVRNVA